GASEGQHQIGRQKSPQGRAKEQGATALQPPQIELTAPVNAFQQGGQAAVESQERVSLPEGVRICQVGEFELIAGNRIAQIREREEAVLGDPVQQLLDHFV